MGGRRALTGHEARLIACWERLAAGRSTAAPAAARASDRKRWLGAFRLRDAQLAAVDRIDAAFVACGGALLADPPGAGKTIVALAVARDAIDAVVIAPAALKAQWERSAARAGMALRFTSFEALSRDARPVVARGGVVIVDEAHHARTAGTRRYARLAALCAGARVLLLSATPVVNRAADRGALLGLFLGERPVGTAASRCVIRRFEVRDVLPEVRRLPPLLPGSTGVDSAISGMIASLPPPLPAADGAAALALVRITLAMAWTSSLAALDAALKRRLQRGAALADALAAGRWPSRAALRLWMVGDDATQLAFPALEPTGDMPGVGATASLAAHLDAVRVLRSVVSPAVAADTARRAHLLDAQQRARPQERVVAFSHQAETIRALWAVLRATGGVVAIMGDRVLAAQGRWHRDDVLRALGPRAAPLREGDPRAIRILLTTDLLSEGVELQGMGTVVHLDRAWTPATMEQREGRVVRPLPSGSPSAVPSRRVVFVTRFRPPRAAEPLLRLGQRLAAKDRARARAVRNAESRAAADIAFAAWRAHRVRDPSVEWCKESPHTAFLAAIRWRAEGRELIVAGVRTGGRWEISESPCVIARLAGSPRVGTPGANHDAIREIRRALAQWLRRQATDSIIGEPVRRAARGRAPWPQLRATVDRLLRASSLAERARRGAALERASATLERHAGAGITRQLVLLLRVHAARAEGVNEFEAAIQALAENARRGGPDAPTRPTANGARPSLSALVLIAPGDLDAQVRPRSPAPSS
jgi:hypothetical protein